MPDGYKRPSPMKIASPAERQLVKQLHEEQHELHKAVAAPMKLASIIERRFSAQLHEEQQKRNQLANQLLMEQQERNQLAYQLHEEQQERNRTVTALWARLEEVDQQIQVLQAQSQERQIQVIAPSPLHAPVQDPNSALLQGNPEASMSVSQNTGSTFKERMQVVMDQTGEHQVRFSKGSPGMVSTMQPTFMSASSLSGSFLEGLSADLDASMAALQIGLNDLEAKHEQLAKEFASMTALQTGLKNLDAKHEQLASITELLDVKHEQLANELPSVKGMLKELEVGMQLSAIRTTRIALQSTSLSMDERKQALAALDKKEPVCLNTLPISARSAVSHT